jgi:hypothetical protein
MANKNNTGIHFDGALLLLFIGLKLGAVIDWSWWWVLSPIWIAVIVAIGAFFLGALWRAMRD